MNTVCLIVDRLHAGYLGCYGNTWIATPHCDRLATESLLLDEAIITSPALGDFYRSCWRGRHPLEPHDARAASLPVVLKAGGVETVLVSDDEQVDALADSAAFTRRVSIEREAAAAPAADLTETHFARFFAAAMDELSRLEKQKPFLLWLHLSGMAAPWDAPPECRERYDDEDEPGLQDMAETTEPPEYRIAADADPDEIWRLARRYAGQVTLWDACLGVFLEHFRGGPWADDTMFSLTSPRGYPLGEHRRVGACDEALHGELVHVPWLLRWPDGAGAMHRSRALVQPEDLAAAVAAWQGGATDWPGGGGSLLALAEAEDESARDRVLIVNSHGERALRTSSWHLRLPASSAPDKQGDEPAPKLFAKPDDWWEVNEVADRCPEVVAGLRAAAASDEQALRAGASTPPAPLDDELLARSPRS